jgi:hypothetical protein
MLVLNMFQRSRSMVPDLICHSFIPALHQEMEAAITCSTVGRVPSQLQKATAPE